jgi:hypothetical protein
MQLDSSLLGLLDNQCSALALYIIAMCQLLHQIQMYPRLFVSNALKILQEIKVVLRQRIGCEAFQQVKILFIVSGAIKNVVCCRCIEVVRIST